MGKHDDYSHFIHTSKQQKFSAPKPDSMALHARQQPPQVPPRKSTAYNRYLGHGKGV